MGHQRELYWPQGDRRRDTVDIAGQIQQHLPVVYSNGKQFGVVDRIERGAINVTKDRQGRHHWIPLGPVMLHRQCGPHRPPRRSGRAGVCGRLAAR